MAEILIVNASPLIFLGNAGHIGLLQGLGARRLVVPEPVFAEVAGSDHADAAARALSQAAWIERCVPPAIPAPVMAWDLGPGESAVMAVALCTPGAGVVIDDALGRRCALSLGLQVVGTVGIVVIAERRGVIQSARRVLMELRSAGMWLSDDVIERALRIAGLGG